jgi:hypothetical protein
LPDVSDALSITETTQVGGNLMLTDGNVGGGVTGTLPPFEMTWGVKASAYAGISWVMVFVSVGASVVIGAGGSWSVSAHGDFSDGGCGGFESSATFNANAYARGGGNAAAGISAGVPGFSIDTGVRGKLELIDLNLTIDAGATVRSETDAFGDPTARAGFSLDVVGKGSVFSGSISVFVEMTIVLLTIPLYELVLASWRGPSIDFRLDATLDTEDGLTGDATGDYCLMQDVRSLWGDARVKDDGCPCYPWESDAECRADSEGTP